MEYTNRNITVSLTRGTGADIVGKTTLFDLMKKMTTDPELLQKGKEVVAAKKADSELYAKIKTTLPGFILGDFSYRNIESCINYYPLIGFDIDSIQSKDEHERIMKTLKKWDMVFLAMPSVSFEGIRVMVWTSATKETHKDYYSAVCNEMAKRAGIKLTSLVRDKFREMGCSEKDVKKFLDYTPHVDDKTSDISRFWFYSGVERQYVYVNFESNVYQLTEVKPTPVQIKSKGLTDGDYPYIFTEEDKIEYIINKIEQRRIDITAGVPEWFKIGVAIASHFGAAGENYFLRLCQFHPDYKASESKKEYNDRCIPKSASGRVALSSLYHICSKHGVEVDYQELVEIHKDKFEKARASRDISLKVAEQNPQLCRVDEEKVLIGVCLDDKNAYEGILDEFPKFSHECFVDQKNRMVFNGIERAYSLEGEVNVLMVAEKLRLQGISINDLKEYLKTDLYKEFFATNVKIVYGNFLKRRMLSVSMEMNIELAKSDTDPFVYVDEVQGKLDGIVGMQRSKTEATISEIMFQVAEDYDKAVETYRNGGNAVTGIPTGLIQLDDITTGWQDTDLIVMGARPGMGKTALLIHFAMAAANAGKKVGIFSLEMSSNQIGARMVAAVSETNTKISRSGNATDGELLEIQKAISGIHDLGNIIIDDMPSVTPEYILRKSKKWKKEHGLDIVMVDYIQIMSTIKFMEETVKTTYISQKLKALAKSLKMPVVALSQLSRAVEARGGNKKPMLSDLRQSGAIEQDADLIIFPYRPEYYNILEDEDGNDLKGVVEIIVAKNRHGSLDSCFAKFKAHCTKFVDSDDYNPNMPVFNANASKSITKGFICKSENFDPNWQPTPTTAIPENDFTLSANQNSVNIKPQRMNTEDVIPF